MLINPIRKKRYMAGKEALDNVFFSCFFIFKFGGYIK